MVKSKEKWVSVTVAGGFYFFGKEVQGPEGYIAIVEASMSGGFSNDLGWPAVLRGDPNSSVILCRFRPEDTQLFPISTVYAIHPAVNLYELKTTTIK